MQDSFVSKIGKRMPTESIIAHFDSHVPHSAHHCLEFCLENFHLPLHISF